ncbi:xylose isomerase-like protein [Baffinella frigidus]|nr:xylose isomerase-like protein [Cryptophyta sp. CCMP2293]
MTHPDPGMREAAVALTKEGCAWARKLGAKELVVWSAFCGYDYSNQVDYVKMWDRVVDAFQQATK